MDTRAARSAFDEVPNTRQVMERLRRLSSAESEEAKGASQVEMDPLLQARQAIGEAQAVLKQFGIDLGYPTVNIDPTQGIEPEPETKLDDSGIQVPKVNQVRSDDRLVDSSSGGKGQANKDAEKKEQEKDGEKGWTGRSKPHVGWRDHKSSLHLHLPKIKLKRGDWISSSHLHLPKLYGSPSHSSGTRNCSGSSFSSPAPRNKHHSHSRIVHKVASVFKRHRSAPEIPALNEEVTKVPEITLKSALRKDRIRRIDDEGNIILGEPSERKPRRGSLCVRFSHVVVIDGAGGEKFYELTPAEVAQKLRLRHGLEISVRETEIIEEHEHNLECSERFFGKSFSRNSEANGMFVKAR